MVSAESLAGLPHQNPSTRGPAQPALNRREPNPSEQDFGVDSMYCSVLGLWTCRTAVESRQ